MTYFNDTMGERKILTRDLLREAISSKNTKIHRIKLPEVKVAYSKLSSQKIYQAPTSMAGVINRSSTNSEEVIYPFSLLEQIIEGRGMSAENKSETKRGFGDVNSLSWLKAETGTGVTQTSQGIANRIFKQEE